MRMAHNSENHYYILTLAYIFEMAFIILTTILINYDVFYVIVYNYGVKCIKVG